MTGTAQVYGAARAVLGWEADALAVQANSIVGHLLTLGYGLGWTTMRAWVGLRRSRPDRIEALWCPLTLPAADRDISTEAARTAAAFRSAFAVDAADGVLLTKGAPAWSDFTLWVSGGGRVRRHALLVMEISYNVPHKTPDFRSERAHLDALSDSVRRLENRGVFARVNAEVQAATPHLSPHLASHLGAFSGRDKPFFKLCQAAAYAESTAALLLTERQLRDPLTVRAVAVTGAGLDSLAADMAQASQDPRRTLMTELAGAYRQAIKVSDAQAQQRLCEEMAMAFRQLARSLPAPFYRQIRDLETAPEPGSPLRPHLSVRVQADQVSLRDVHAAAVVTGLAAMRPGRLTVLALEGNPGIGKTTAVQRHLTAQVDEGFLLLYVSPRTVINKDVTAKFARNDAGESTGIATLTTNGELIAQAGAAFRQARPADARRIDSAVVVDGRDDLAYPDDTSIWFMTPAQEDAMEGDWVGRSVHKRRLDARTDTLVDQRPPGVLRTLGAAAKRLLDANQDLRRLVLTASIQSYRRLGDGTTIAGLSGPRCVARTFGRPWS